jgi:hypothetical protein
MSEQKDAKPSDPSLEDAFETAEREEDGVDLAPPLPGGASYVQSRPRQRKRWILLSVGTAILSFALALLVIGLIMVMGRSVALPGWVTQELEARVNAQIEGSDIEITGLRVGLLDDQMRPTIELEGLWIRAGDDRPLMALPEVQVKLDTSELIQGRIALETLDIQNAQVNLVRDRSGQFSLALGSGLGSDEMAVGSVAEALEAVDALFEQPAMRELEEVRVAGVALYLDDQRLGRQLEVADGRLTLVNGANFLALSVAFDISMDGGAPSTLVLSADKAKGAGGGRFEAEFSQLRMRDVAEQVDTLNFLSLLDAPVDGSLRTEFGAEGELVSFRGMLDIGKGVLQPAPQAKALPLNRARTDIRYSSATGRLHLEGLEIDAPELRLGGQGYADLRDFEAGIPQTLLMQIRLADISLDPEGIFETPVTFAEGQADLRYRPNALRLDVGQLVLRDAGTEIVASGQVSVEEAGWLASVDAEIGTIAQSDLLAMWPTSAVAKTRNWLTTNIQSGELTNAAAALRVVPGQPANAAVTFDFEGANVRYMRTLPEVEQGRGYLSIAQNELTLAVHEGHVTVPSGGRLEVGGSVLQIPDIAQKDPVAEISLHAKGPIEAALSLLDEPPFEFLSKSGLATNLADGEADVIARLSVPLIRQLRVADVGYAVDARLSDVSSDSLIPERRLTASEMRLSARDGALVIEGPIEIDGIPANIAWQRALGREGGDGSTVTGTVELSPRMLETFNVALPEGSLAGQGVGELRIALSPSEPPALTLTSDLRGVGLRIDPLGWAKGPGEAGQLELRATLGQVPRIDRLNVSAAGLEAQGQVSVRPEGGLNRAIFSPLRVAGRLNSQVELIGRGRGVPVQIAVRGGSIDIRNFGVGASGGRAAGGPPLDLTLDSLRVTDDIRIDGFRGQFSNASGLSGNFTGQVNGGATINGTVVPTDRGLAVRIASDNGGGVIASTGLFRNARGGDMNLVLQPTGVPGEFNGQLTVLNTRIKKAPALADLLSALSVVGLLEQLSGDGILFSEVEAFFKLSPGGVRLRESRAVGPSMGITMDGVYSTAQRRMQMQGVVSPIYLVNRPLGFLFSKKGEGLFGFTYQLTGAADAPKVNVNPLSVFTPGRFRDIFRRPPPQPQN